MIENEKDMLDMSVLRNPDIKPHVKYVYLCIIMELTNNNTYDDISLADGMTFNAGISRNMFYKARKILIDKDILRVHKRFCEKTGKRLGDIYEFV